MSDDELLKRLDEPIIAEAFGQGAIISSKLSERLIRERSEAAARIRVLEAELAFYKGFHDGVCKDGTHVVVPVEKVEK